MAIIHEFSYEKPRKLKTAMSLRTKFGDRCRFLAGGTDLINHINDGLELPEVLIDIKGIKSLNKIEIKDHSLSIGALVTFSDLIDSPLVKKKCPLMTQMSETVACVGIRNRATMVGNICSAVPSMDSAPVLMVFDSEVLVQSEQAKRKIPIEKWFLAPRQTVLSMNEIVAGLSIPIPKKKHYGLFLKLGRYRGEDLAQAGISILALENHEYRIAFCAVDAIPKRSHRIEDILKGKKLSDSLIKKVRKAIESEINPITDIRASKKYRMHMVKVMMERGLKAVHEGLNGKKIKVDEILGA